MAGETGVVLYSTSVATSSKLRTDIQHVRHILEALGIEYSEVDLAREPSKRAAMLAASGTKLLPQLHKDGQYIGDALTVQDMNDNGTLTARLQGECKLINDVGSTAVGTFALPTKRTDTDISASRLHDSAAECQCSLQLDLQHVKHGKLPQEV